MLVRAGNRGGVREGWVGVVYCHIKPGDRHPGIMCLLRPPRRNTSRQQFHCGMKTEVRETHETFDGISKFISVSVHKRCTLESHSVNLLDIYTSSSSLSM